MRVIMLRHITGSRDGVAWPLKGGEIDLPDHEAADLIAAGHAKEAPDADPIASPVAEDLDAGPVPGDDQPAAGPEPDGAAAVEDDEPAAGPEPDDELVVADGLSLEQLDKAQLLAVAADHDVEVSARWGEARLRSTLAAALRLPGAEA